MSVKWEELELTVKGWQSDCNRFHIAPAGYARRKSFVLVAFDYTSSDGNLLVREFANPDDAKKFVEFLKSQPHATAADIDTPVIIGG